MKKRLLACILALMLLLSMMPVTAIAAEPVATGTCGATGNEDNVTWKLKQNNSDSENPTYTLTISGTGAIRDYAEAKGQPWYSYANAITAVTLENGITAIGAHSLRQLTAINSPLALPRSLEKIGSCALYMAHFSAFTVDAENTAFTAENGVLYNKDMTTLIAYPCGSAQISYVAPTSVQKISAYAFSSVTSLQTADFSAATDLSQVGQQAFESASSVNALFKNDGEITVQYEALKGIRSVAMRCASLKLAPYAFKDTDYVDLSSVTDIDAAFGGWWSTNPKLTINGLNANVIAGADQVYTASEALAKYLSKLPIRDRSTKAPELVIVDGGQFAEKSFAQAKDTYTPQKMKFAFGGWEKAEEYTNTSCVDQETLTASIYRAKWMARTLTGLKIEPKKSEVLVGTTLTLDDFTVTAVYDGGEQEIVLTEGYTIEPVEALTTLGDVEVTAMFDGKTATCTIKVVSAPVVPVNPVKPVEEPTTPWWSLLPALDQTADFPFYDVDANDWFYEAVKSAWENELIDGVTARYYMPDNTLTVAQTVKLAAALHQKQSVGFVTLQNGGTHWYDNYVNYAVANSLIEAAYQSKSAEAMNAAVTRAEFVHILSKLLNAGTINTVNNIPDVKSGDAYADEIFAFYRAGILTGSDRLGTFHPTSSLKRSEAAAILVRLYDATQRQYITLG